MYDRGFGLTGPRQVHAEYKMHTCKAIYMLVACDVKRTHAIQMLHVQFGSRLDGSGVLPAHSSQLWVDILLGLMSFTLLLTRM